MSKRPSKTEELEYALRQENTVLRSRLASEAKSSSFKDLKIKELEEQLAFHSYRVSVYEQGINAASR